MKLRFTLISAISICLLSAFAFAADEDMVSKLSAHEKSLLEAIKSQNWDAFSAGTAPEILDIDPMGVVMTKQQLLDEFKKFTLNDYTLSDFKTFDLNENAVVLSYTADTSGTMNEQTMQMKVVHTSTYVKQNGKWWPKFHTETPVVTPPTQTRQ
jgi:Domain of unknown function (DUF4440)